MLSVGLFALVVAIGAATVSLTTWLLDRWLIKVFDPAALPPPVKVRKAKSTKYEPTARRGEVVYPDGRKEI